MSDFTDRGERRTPVRAPIPLRNVATLRVRAPLARAMMRADDRKPTGLARLRNKIAKSLFALVHQRFGVPAWAEMQLASRAAFRVDCANTAFLLFQAHVARYGGWEPEVTALLSALAGRLRVVYDVGANWGYFALQLGTDPAFGGTIHAFEINPRTLRDLRCCVEGAGLAATVTCHGFGLSDRDGELRLTRDLHSMLARVAPEGHAGPSARVAVRRLDGLGLPAPDLIKLDVEGHEAAVLRGASETIARAAPWIVFENWYDPERPDAQLEPLRWLEGQGYGFYRIAWEAGVLRLDSMSAAERQRTPGTLNLLAVHAARRDVVCALRPPDV
ncbi:MAG: FkbM family methyltransferase [Pseudomonadota bacterium]